MPLHMRRVGIDHALILDTKTDKSHLVSSDKPEDYLFTFDSSGHGFVPSGEQVCRLVPVSFAQRPHIRALLQTLEKQ